MRGFMTPAVKVECEGCGVLMEWDGKVGSCERCLELARLLAERRERMRESGELGGRLESESMAAPVAADPARRHALMQKLPRVDAGVADVGAIPVAPAVPVVRLSVPRAATDEIGTVDSVCGDPAVEFGWREIALGYTVGTAMLGVSAAVSCGAVYGFCWLVARLVHAAAQLVVGR